MNGALETAARTPYGRVARQVSPLLDQGYISPVLITGY